MSTGNTEQVYCPICRKQLDDVTTIRQKGAEGINDASCKRGDDIFVAAGCKVHTNCRKVYINPADISNTLIRYKGETSTVVKRTAHPGSFDSNSDCLFCGTKVVLANKDYSFVKTDAFFQAVIDCCNGRSDDWAFTVKGRIEYYWGDLHAADCLYHHTCSTNFRSGRDMPLKFRNEPIVKRRKSGRPKDDDQEQAFRKVCGYLEANDEEQLTITDLQAKMEEYLSCKDSLPYCRQWLKCKLQEYYGNAIHIAEGKGQQSCVVTMREKTSQILRSYFESDKGDEESQRRAIIETAARLIKSDIKTTIPSVTDHYPDSDTLKLDSALHYIPDTLRALLDTLFVGTDTRRKVAGIGHAIAQAVRPRAIQVPLQIGLAAQMQHIYRSKFLVDTLSEMGFCSSYGEVLRFEKNAANSVPPDVLGDDIDQLDATLLFAADNVDHNIITIDGKGTFHGMGMIVALTPGKQTKRIIPRRMVSELNITERPKLT